MLSGVKLFSGGIMRIDEWKAAMSWGVNEKGRVMGLCNGRHASPNAGSDAGLGSEARLRRGARENFGG